MLSKHFVRSVLVALLFLLHHSLLFVDCSFFFCRKATLRRRKKGGWVVKTLADLDEWLAKHTPSVPTMEELEALDSDKLFVIPGSKFMDDQYGEGFGFTSLKVC